MQEQRTSKNDVKKRMFKGGVEEKRERRKGVIDTLEND